MAWARRDSNSRLCRFALRRGREGEGEGGGGGGREGEGEGEGEGGRL